MNMIPKINIKTKIKEHENVYIIMVLERLSFASKLTLKIANFLEQTSKFQPLAISNGFKILHIESMTRKDKLIKPKYIFQKRLIQ